MFIHGEICFFVQMQASIVECEQKWTGTTAVSTWYEKNPAKDFIRMSADWSLFMKEASMARRVRSANSSMVPDLEQSSWLF